MNDQQLQQLEILLQEKKFSEAGVVLQDIFAEKMSPESKGGILTDSALAYISTLNQINGAYAEALEDALKELEETDIDERKTDDALALSKAKLSLKSL